MENQENSVAYRELHSDDLPLIYNSFLQHFVRAALTNATDMPRCISFMDRRVVFDYWTEYLRVILENPMAKVSIACWQSQPHLIFGWAIRLDDDLVYIFVKKDYRNKGIARQMLKELGFTKHMKIQLPTNAGISLIHHIFPRDWV